MFIAPDEDRFQDVERVLMQLTQDENAPKWLVEALKIANAKAVHIITPSKEPCEPPRFTYPH